MKISKADQSSAKLAGELYIYSMETISLCELNQNPSRAVVRVRAGEAIIVTDRGRPILRMVPEAQQSSVLKRMIETGEVRPPTEYGMPEVVPDLAPNVPSLSDLLIAERNR
ncbi:MAG: type II toxin-antitoxin system Phd/YefM family antitoxin [Candidatus Dormibacteraceae bacterium]